MDMPPSTLSPSLILTLSNPSIQGYDASNGPNYVTAAATPSPLPPRPFCSVCGHWGRHACARCGMRYCCLKCQETHKVGGCACLRCTSCWVFFPSSHSHPSSYHNNTPINTSTKCRTGNAAASSLRRDDEP